MCRHIYTGIGSRETPENVLQDIFRLAAILAKHNFILRSGGAPGADSAFENGCDSVKGKKEIYLPWKGFNDNKSPLYEVSDDALSLAEKFHPRWSACSYGAKKLHARNCYQVLGEDLKTPTSFIICWSKGTGGTEQALRIAKEYKIPIINMFKENWQNELFNLISNFLNFLKT